MSKANKAPREQKAHAERAARARAQAEAIIEKRARIMMLAALARKLGEPDEVGGKVIELSEEDLMDVPEGEMLDVNGEPDGSGGVTIRVYQKPDDGDEDEAESD